MTGVRHIRFHGRGGTGVKLAARILGRAAFLTGRTVQDSPLYGAERRGAPVVAFVRLADGPILERGYVERPDVLVITDASQLGLPEAAVLDGVHPGTLVLVNSPAAAEGIASRHGIPGRVLALDVSAIVLADLGRHVLSAAAAACTAKAARLAPWDAVAEAVRIELGESGVAGDVLARNLVAARHAFEAAPAVGLGAPVPAPPAAPPAPPAAAAPLFVVPRLPARVAGPAIVAPGTSARRTTEGWRIERPVIHLEGCTRCVLCFALCPEGAIRLDAEHWPVVDYAHCKGCLVCVSECPTGTIEAVREVAV